MLNDVQKCEESCDIAQFSMQSSYATMHLHISKIITTFAPEIRKR